MFKKSRHCSICGAEGHDKRTCISAKSSPSTLVISSMASHSEDLSVGLNVLPEPRNLNSENQNSNQSSRIQLTEEQREKFLSSDIQTGIVFEYKSRVGKAIRSSVVAASVESNFDPLLALKAVLIALPAHRRGEILKRRLDLFFTGNAAGLLTELQEAASKAQSIKKKPQREISNTSPNRPAMAALAAGCPGKALRRLNMQPLVEPTPAVIERMRSLHPFESPPLPPLGPLPTAPPLSSKAVFSTLRAMRLSGPGPSGLRADHLLMAYERRSNNCLTSLLDKIAQGAAPPWLADARLLAVPKKGGGERPIAVGEVLRRAAAGALIRMTSNELRNIPRQFVLRRDGCLAATSAVKSAIEINNKACIIQLDMSNAFNSIHRSAVLLSTDKTPLAQYARWAYAEPSRLRFGNESIISSSGVQQGDPAGPVFFALALSSIMSNVRETFPLDLLDIWYADDACLVGTLEEVIEGFKQIISPLQSIGLKINQKKCLLWSRDAIADSTIEVPFADSNSTLIALGFPIAGTEESYANFASKAVERATSMLQTLPRLHHTQ